MGYINLLLGRTPGMNVARFAAKAEGAMTQVGTSLPELERAGKGLPADPLFRTPANREAARQAFDDVASQFSNAQGVASQFSYANSSTSTFQSLVSAAESARDSARRLQSDYPLDGRIGYDMNAATQHGISAVAALEPGRYSNDTNMQRALASIASGELSSASTRAYGASAGLHAKLAPFQRYDDVRLATEDASGYALHTAQKSAHVKAVSAATHATATEAAGSVRDEQAVLDALQPGQSTTTLANAVKQAQAALARAHAAGSAEPAPPHWGAKVAATRIGTGVGVAAAGGGIYLGVRKLGN